MIELVLTKAQELILELILANTKNGETPVAFEYYHEGIIRSLEALGYLNVTDNLQAELTKAGADYCYESVGEFNIN